MSDIYDKWNNLENNSSHNLVPSFVPTKNDKMRKIDNFLPEDLYIKLYQTLMFQRFTPNWDRGEADKYGHWNSNFLKHDHASNLADKSNDFENVVAKEVWDWVKENVPEFRNKILLRCYMNAHTYGIEGYFHKDSERNNEKTMVLYIVNGNWDKDWGGETVFAENEDLVNSVLPKQNRAIVFDSNIDHCARGVTKAFTGLRKTFMFKARDRRSDNFEKLSAFLAKHKAHYITHKRGSLHDHLVRVFQSLENKNAPRDICFAAGIHSIFGTNVFKNKILELKDKDIVTAEFGERVFELAALFSIIDRPDVLENAQIDPESGQYHMSMVNGNIVAVDQLTFDSLRLIEGANLDDQHELDESKFPNIHKFYTNYGKNA